MCFAHLRWVFPLLAGDDLHRDRVDSRAPLVLPVYRQIGTARDPDCLSVAAMFRIWMASRSRGLQSPNPTGECSRPFPRSNHRSRQAPPSKRRRVVHRYDMLNRLGQIPSHVTYYKTQHYFGRLEILNLPVVGWDAVGLLQLEPSAPLLEYKGQAP